MKGWIVLATAVLVASVTLTAKEPAVRKVREGTQYWRLGAGFYAGSPVGNESDEARWEWLVLNFGNMGASIQTIQRLNRNLKLNPRQKYLGELWPINHLGKPHRYVQQATMFDYRYNPQVREALEKELRRQVRILLDNILKPENVIGFTFLEEVPGHWGAGDQICWQDDPNKMPPILEEFRKEIEAERGKPLVWDDETRLWVGKVFVETINRIHKIIKEEAPNKLVLFWQHIGYATLDDIGFLLPADAPLSSRGLYPYRFSDIIRPGLCEGFMAYPNNAEVWEKKYMRHVRQKGWVFFSQLSHPGFMRLQPWKDALQMAKTKLPQNLGYFLFCQGDCAARKQWNEDPAVPDKPEENLYTVSIPRHIRRFCAQEKVGMDVVARYLRLRVQMDVPLKGAKAGDVIHVVALVENPKEPIYYLNSEEAIAKGVKATISLPHGFRLNGHYSAPATLLLGDMKALERKVAEWWVTVVDGRRRGESGSVRLTPSSPIKVVVTSANTQPGQAIVTEDVAIPAFEAHNVSGSGESWIESGYRLGQALRPIVVMEGLSTPIKNPSVSDGVNTLTYRGELFAGLKVVITPDGKARLYAAELVDKPTEGLTDPEDPTGFKAFSEGYGIWAQYLGKYLKGGAKYRVSISGKAEGGANSMVWLRCWTQEGKLWETGLLWDAFTEKWQDDVRAEIEIPVGVNQLERVYLYRYHTKGRIWYGKISIQRADIPAQGVDVSGFVSGTHIVLQPGTFTTITYHDDDQPSRNPKVRIQLQPTR